MAMVKGKDELCRIDDIKKYFNALQAIEGKTLFERYKLAETNVINRNIDAEYQHFLAYPVQEGNTITFHGKKYNETPRLLSELQGDDLTKYTSIKEETLAHFNNKINSLRNSGRTSEAVFLADAVKYVDNRFVYCYDDKVVLGCWGMRLRDNVREDISVIRQNLVKRRKGPIIADSPLVKSEPDLEPQSEEPPADSFKIRFDAGENGRIIGNSEIAKFRDQTIAEDEVPKIEPKDGYEFTGWDSENPVNYQVAGDKVFTAKFREIPRVVPPPVGTYIDKREDTPKKSFWERLRPWLKWLLLLLLLLLLLCLLFRGCRHAPQGIPYPIEGKPWAGKNPPNGGGIYNPGKPYAPVPTPRDYRKVLPPKQGVLPPVDTSKAGVIRDPNMPPVIANRLNILMENEDKSIMDLAKDFKAKYPDSSYKVVYYDDVVKRMQIEVPEVPSSERAALKDEIRSKFEPDGYKLFVFDEALFEARYKPDDPAFNDSATSWYLHAVKAPQAWDTTRGSSKHTIAVVDNGFNLTHPELKDKVVMPYNVWLHSDKVFPQQDDHGTHVAGTALAIADNGKGIAGIASECAFMPVQVADAKGLMTTTSMLDGILYALYQGADVINVSLGINLAGLDALPEEVQREMIRSRFKEEERMWNKITEIADNHKAVIVVAAGNDNVLAGISPQQRPKNIITVSATDKQNQPSPPKADFSNYGEYSTVSAPGVDIYSCVGRNGYTMMSGTSMAAPIVTGGVALIKALNESLTAEQIICILQSTGLPAGSNVGKLVQLDRALEAVKSGDTVNCAESSSPCNTNRDADGGDEGYVGSFEMGQKSGSFVFRYNTHKVPDRITIYDGRGTGGTVIFKYNGGTRRYFDSVVEFNDSVITVEVISLGYGTAWNFEVNCPDGQNPPGSNPAQPNNPNIPGAPPLGGGRSALLPPGSSIGTPPSGNKRDELLRERERLRQRQDEIDRELRGVGN
jgi:subtilisin family serine protease